MACIHSLPLLFPLVVRVDAVVLPLSVSASSPPLWLGAALVAAGIMQLVDGSIGSFLHIFSLRFGSLCVAT